MPSLDTMRPHHLIDFEIKTDLSGYSLRLYDLKQRRTFFILSSNWDVVIACKRLLSNQYKRLSRKEGGIMQQRLNWRKATAFMVPWSTRLGENISSGVKKDDNI